MCRVGFLWRGGCGTCQSRGLEKKEKKKKIFPSSLAVRELVDGVITPETSCLFCVCVCASAHICVCVCVCVCACVCPPWERDEFLTGRCGLQLQVAGAAVI